MAGFSTAEFAADHLVSALLAAPAWRQSDGEARMGVCVCVGGGGGMGVWVLCVCVCVGGWVRVNLMY